MKNMRFLLPLVLAITVTACNSDKNPVYKDALQPIDKRVADLLSRMTLEEKIAQLDMVPGESILETSKELSMEKMEELFKENPKGSVHDVYPASAELANQIQRYAIENTRLGIPIIFIEEGLHGYAGYGATTFPIPLGNASTWDTVLMRSIGRIIGTEARAHGVHMTLGPNLDLAREPRWGRTEETFGEDTYLSSRMAVNLVKGMQGNSLKDNNTAVAEPKHFGIHGIPENGSNASPVPIGEREARSTHLYVFEKAVKEGGARGIMAAYNEIDGIPCAGNKWLLTDLLRGEWGFKGFVVSDLGAVSMQRTTHRTVATEYEAMASSLNAGLNMQFYDFPHEKWAAGVLDGVTTGKISMQAIDRACGDILRVKFELGLFDDPYTDTSLVGMVHHSADHAKTAREVSLASIVMLKNDNKTLPLSKDIRNIAVVGSLANVSSVGGYSPAGARGVTVIEALEKRFGGDVRINWVNSEVSASFMDIPPSAMTPAKGEGDGLYTEFFNNINFDGQPAHTDIQSNLSPYWHNLSPAPGVNKDNFSVRWSGTLKVTTAGIYEFSQISDDYGRIYLDGKLLIDNWSDQKRNVTTTAQAYLEKGRDIPFRVEYAEVDQFAGQRVKWKYIGGPSVQEMNRQVTAAAAQADAVIVVVGESIDEVGEGKDRQNLRLHQIDIDMVKAAAAAGKPVTTILLNGRPLIINDINDASSAILEAWFPGEAGGDAIADILFGDYNPSGRLTISFPQSMGQLPIYYSRKNSAPRGSVDGNPDPLYAFGHGLSYSEFEYSNLAISPAAPSVDGNFTVSLDVKNISGVAGAEVVQLYVRDVVGSVATPVIALKGFSKIYLEPGESKRVEMVLTPEHLSLINLEMKRVTEPGEFEIMVGRSSKDIRLREIINVI